MVEEKKMCCEENKFRDEMLINVTGAGNNGGAIYNSGNVNPEQTIFQNNESGTESYGGAIYANGKTEITKTDIKFVSGGERDCGGAIYVGK